MSTFKKFPSKAYFREKGYGIHHSPFLSLVATKRFYVLPNRIRQVLVYLRRSTLRYHIAFLKERLEVIVFVNLFSGLERRKWKALQTRFG